jgi:membrane-bound serine protease (ClpP class)
MEEEGEVLITLFTDPNVLYLIVLFGLWFAAAAIYVPGTGLLEAMAGAVVIAGIYGLAQMPTNWLAVMVLVLGVMTFLVLPFIQRRYAPLAAGGLVLQVIGALLLFNGPQVSWLLITGTVAIQFLYHFFVLTPMLRKQNSENVLDEDVRLIGARGRVLKALDPVGTVQAAGEIWTATSNRTLEAGTEVVVVEREGLQIYVEAIKPKRRNETNKVEEKWK